MAAAFLDPEWLDLLSAGTDDLPAEAGVTAAIQHVVTGGPDGNVNYTTRVEDGRVVSAALGKDLDADLTFTSSYEGAQRMARGELETGAAFMQGSLKVEGDMAKLLPLLEVLHRPERRAHVAAVAAQTDF